MILSWSCLMSLVAMVSLRAARGQVRCRRVGSGRSWISVIASRVDLWSAEGGNGRLFEDLAADDVDCSGEGVPVGVGAQVVGGLGDEGADRVLGDQQRPGFLLDQVGGS